MTEKQSIEDEAHENPPVEGLEKKAKGQERGEQKDKRGLTVTDTEIEKEVVSNVECQRERKTAESHY